MKKGIHPESYRPVVFKDMSNGDMFLSKSTVNTKETIEFEGETYPLQKKGKEIEKEEIPIKNFLFFVIQGG